MKSNLFISFLFILILLPFSVSGQRQSGEVVIQGTVTAHGEGPVIGVNVAEIDANNRVVSGTITDFNGRYVLRIKNPANRLTFSYIGFLKQTKKIGTATRIDVVLVDDTQTIKDVVVTATRRHSEGGFSIPQREISTAIQTIKMEELEGLQVSSVDEALQGRIAGLDIVASSGDAGSGSSMRIRGASSITGNNQPLIVLNGVPYEMQVDQNFDYANSNQEQFANLLSINPDDIQEISVLKDASASAIWGSKGANGVIMITTKKGRTGPTRVEYSYRYTGTVQPQGRKLLNGDDYTMLMKQAFFNPRQNSNASNVVEYNYDKSFIYYEDYNNNTDWVDAVTQIGNISDHYLTLSGGGERATYRISGGFLNQNGTIIGQTNSRLSTRSYIDYRVSDRLKFMAELSYTYSNYNRSYNYNFGGSPNENMSILGIAYVKMPNSGIFKQDANGNDTDEYFMTPSTSGLNPDQRNLVNPVALALLAKNNVRNYRTLPTFRIQYDLLDPADQILRYNMYVSFDINNDRTTKFLPSELTNQRWSDSRYNRAESFDNEAVTIQTDNNLMWNTKFAEDHDITLYGSFQTTEGRSNRQGVTSYGLISGSAGDASTQGYLNYQETGRSHWRNMAVMGRMHYAYKSRYVFDATLRRDGSTKFGNGRKWGNFPGVSVKWILSDEPFMDFSNNWLSMLAFRPGWGLAGNQPGAEYLHFSRYRDDGSYAGESVQVPSSLQLKNLKWETTSSFNYGMDLGLLNDRIFLDANVYFKRTKDMLFGNVQIPNSSGFSSLNYQNAGTMDNSGWELNFYANKIINAGKFSADFRMNFANSVNTIVYLEDKILQTFNGQYDYRNGSYLTRIQEGNAYGSIYGFEYLGVYQYDKYLQGTQENAPVARDAQNQVITDEKGEPLPMYFNFNERNGAASYRFRGGDAIYKDQNHDGNIDELDIVYLGNSNPRLVGGFGTTLRYGNLSCTLTFNYRVGNKIVNDARMWSENMYSTNNQSTVVNWRWRKEGDVTSIPRALYEYGYNWLGSNRFVEDGSFLRFKYLTLNYSVPKAMLKPFKVDKLNFYLSMNNIFVLTRYTGVDPEVGYGALGISKDTGRTPRSKDLTLGITVGL
jgi:TonB-linked SusC/RagA family outer membrane protein